MYIYLRNLELKTEYSISERDYLLDQFFWIAFLVLSSSFIPNRRNLTWVIIVIILVLISLYTGMALLFQSVNSFYTLIKMDGYGTEDGAIESYVVHVTRLVIQLPQVLFVAFLIICFIIVCNNFRLRRNRSVYAENNETLL